MDEYELKYKPYNRSNVSRARNLRKKETFAEDKMWDEFLKNRPLGYKFTRQKPIRSFIVDFYCSKLSLAIELDGEIHKDRQDYDQERDALIHKYGITIIRFENNEIIKEPDTSYRELLKIMKELENKIKIPLSPPVKGDLGGL